MKSILNLVICGILLLWTQSAHSQVPFSVATDIGVIKNFSEGQGAWAIGQNINGQFHLTSRNSIFAWFSYSTRGRFREDMQAVARSPLTTPSSIDFNTKTTLSMGEISVGWKHYLFGSFDAEQGVNGYGLAGLGVMMGRVNNSYSARVDTSLYDVPVKNGAGRFNRLTLDLGLGMEAPVGGDIFLYGEAKTFIPLTNYPSLYLRNNHYSPLIGFLSFGIRVLFN